MNSTNGSGKNQSSVKDFVPEWAVRERGTGTVRTLYDSTSTSVFKDSAWNCLIFKDFQGLVQGLSNSKDLQALSLVLTYI